MILERRGVKLSLSSTIPLVTPGAACSVPLKKTTRAMLFAPNHNREFFVKHIIRFWGVYGPNQNVTGLAEIAHLGPAQGLSRPGGPVAG